MVKAKCAPYLARGKPACRNPMINEDDYTIVAKFGAEYRGIVQYYLLAGDVYRLHRLRWVMETSMLKTLARKHRSSVSKMAARHKAKIATPHGPRTCFEASIERDRQASHWSHGSAGSHSNGRRTAVLTDRRPPDRSTRTRQLITRLLKGRCELCKRTDNIEVHHVRKLADLDRTGQPHPHGPRSWPTIRRKTLVVCGDCHDLIHGHPATPLTQ